MNNPAPLLVAPTLVVNQGLREAMKYQHACCVWLTGLSGAGKSTLANELEQALHTEGFHTYLLDGDQVRQGLCRDLGMSDADRHENVRRISEVARLMVDAGLIVIVSAISPFRADRDALRHTLAAGAFIEVHVSTPLTECSRRDAKGLYRAVREGRISNFTGIDSPYEVPLQPEFVIDTSQDDTGTFIAGLLRRITQ
ncbi:adenylyl-sulfate kinase [Pseudomonas sp. NPDC089734]|uniref:adenylyl-sulfate kinase n=1 Tax=Pseudomonas sp. NPDC089734 TaxID=3364469 RepID=UPI0038134084